MVVDSTRQTGAVGDSAPAQERRSDRHPASPTALLGGVLVTAAGLAIARSEASFDWFLPAALDLPWRIHHGDAAAVGVLIATVGAAATAFVGRRWVPDRLGADRLPPTRLRLDRRSVLALIAGFACLGMLYGRLAAGAYLHADIALFILGLALVGLAIYWSDPEPTARRVTLRWRDVLAMLMIFAGTASVNAIALTRWDFGWIGDEGAFFLFADLIASTNWFHFFSLRLVYDTHPVLDSVYQAAVMKLFGQNVFGWRMSEVLLLAVSAVLMYAATSLMIGRGAGLVAGAITGTNHYLMAFARIAYNNLHVAFYTTLVALMLALAWRTQRAIFVYAAGVAMGFCLYTFQAAMLLWPIVGVFLLTTLIHRPLRQSVPPVLVITLGFVLVVTPALITTSPERVLEVGQQNTQREQALVDHGAVARQTLLDSFLAFWSFRVDHQRTHQWR
jgi:hypothetical protein